MKHQAYIRKVPEAKTAVLCIHGIVGSPRHFDKLIEHIPSQWTVYNILLEGHGLDVKAFGAASMAAWRAQAQRTVEELAQEHENILIVAHSMGTLFAIEQAVRRPDKVRGIFLLAVPLRVFVKPLMVSNAMKVFTGKIQPTDILAVATREACGTTQSKRVWEYVSWVPRFLELFRQIRYTRKLLPQLKTPCLAVQSRQDEMVAVSSAKLLEPYTRVQMLEHSGHFYYAPQDLQRLMDMFDGFLKE